MQQGSFEVTLRRDAPDSLWNNFERFGHIVITPQEMEPKLVGGPAVLASARYTGVLLEKVRSTGQMTVSGAGMEWWLGDEEGKGDIYETAVSLSNSTLTAALTSLLPPSITKGTVGTMDVSYTGTHQWETPLEAVRTVTDALAAEFKLQPDGTLDADFNTVLYPTLISPTVMIVRHGSGSDPNYIGVPVSQLVANENARPYASRGVLVDDTDTLVVGQSRTPVPTQYDIHGNLIDRTLVLRGGSSNPIPSSVYLTSNMNQHVVFEEQTIDTDFYEIIAGTLGVGEGFYCWDPPSFFNTGNQAWFRGGFAFPEILRLIRADWSLREGMGVYYRPPLATVTVDDWLDLTRWVEWEDITLSIAKLRTFVPEESEGC
jgi:hypothetical protein